MQYNCIHALHDRMLLTWFVCVQVGASLLGPRYLPQSPEYLQLEAQFKAVPGWEDTSLSHGAYSIQQVAPHYHT